MSAVLPTAMDAAGADERSEGVWHAAWRRFKSDRVGLVSAPPSCSPSCVLILTWPATGLVAKNWQREVGVANAPPTFIGPRPPEAMGAIDTPAGPERRPVRRRPAGAALCQEWDERAAQLKTAETPKAETLPLGGDRLGRDVLDKAIKGTEISRLRRRAGGARGDDDRHRARRLLAVSSGAKRRRPARVALQRLREHPRHPAHLRVCRRLRAGRRHRRA
jgi:hypothetical protein